MKSNVLQRPVFSACLLAVALTNLMSPTSSTAAEPVVPAGFRALFNGKDLTGWYGLNPHSVAKLTGEKKDEALKKMRDDFSNHWRVENGELVNDGHGAYATTDEDFGDIELLIEYKTVPKADSGVYLRGLPQVQIWDVNQPLKSKDKIDRSPEKGSGGLFNNTPGTIGRDPLVLADKPFGEWNTFRIIQIGAKTWVWLNDKLVVPGVIMENYADRKQPLPAKGPIMLQTHGGEIRWRNIFVRNVDASEADKLPKAEGQSTSMKLPPKDQFHLYLLVGQSNMAGRGKVEAEDQKPHDRVLMLSKDGHWVPAVDPMHFDKPSAGVGLGKTFGIHMAEANPNATIGLIPCAVGGSPIDSWKPGYFYAPTKSHPWDDAIRRAKTALESGTLQGILWHQGESDSSGQLAVAYGPKLQDLVARFRNELNAPNVPFIVGQLGQFSDKPWDDAKKTVDAAHRNLAVSVPNAAFVPSDSLVAGPDGVHFDAPSLREFGKLYAEAMKKLQQTGKVTASANNAGK